MSPQHEVMNIGRYAVDLVAALGSSHVFTLTGGMAMHLNRAVARNPRLTAIYCQHEQACVAAAEGFAKATGFRQAGFAVVTAGPGVSNTTTALVSAFGDSTPLIVLAGQIKRADIDRYGTRTHGIQEVRSRDLISPCVKRFERLDPVDFKEQLTEALVEAFVGRPGPVFVEIPLDVQGMPIASSAEDIELAAESIRTRVAEARALDAFRHALVPPLNALLAANRPLLYVGNGVRIAAQEETVRSFAERHEIPMVFSWLSFDMLQGDHPLNFGCPGGLAPISANQILSHADTIVFLGARLDLGTTAFQRDSFGAQAERWMVDVDPAELVKFGDLSSARTVEADLHALPAAIASLQESGGRDCGDWLSWARAVRADYLTIERERLRSERLNVYNVAQILSRFSADRVIVPASSGFAEETFTRFFVPGPGSRFFNGAALGAMGMGLPNAIGAAAASNVPVWCLEADGGIMLNIQELATLKHYAPLGFILFVLNNNGYVSIRSSQERHFGEIYGASLDSGVFIPSFEELARAFRIDYVRIGDKRSLEVFMHSQSPTSAPILVELLVDEIESRGPSVRTSIDANGQPMTTPLKEVSW